MALLIREAEVRKQARGTAQNRPRARVQAPGRCSPDDITLFGSLGIAIEDIAPATIVYHEARECGIGVEIPIWT